LNNIVNLTSALI